MIRVIIIIIVNMTVKKLTFMIVIRPEQNIACYAKDCNLTVIDRNRDIPFGLFRPGSSILQVISRIGLIKQVLDSSNFEETQ